MTTVNETVAGDGTGHGPPGGEPARGGGAVRAVTRLARRVRVVAFGPVGGSPVFPHDGDVVAAGGGRPLGRKEDGDREQRGRPDRAENPAAAEGSHDPPASSYHQH